MALTTNREQTYKISSLEKHRSDVKSKDFTNKRTQAIRSISANFNLIDTINKFDFTDSKMEKSFAYEYHYWRVNKKIIDINNKRDRSPETLRLMEKR